MAYDLRYHPKVEAEDLPKLSPEARRRVRRALEARLAQEPDRYGAPLAGTLRGYWKLRVGDYRIVFARDQRTVSVVAILHRRDAYERAERRLR